MHSVVLSVGSNIDPVENIRRAIDILHLNGEICKISNVYETEAVGGPGPNYFNLAILLKTNFEQKYLKWNVLRTIEEKLGRVRTTDKNAARTIDIDITLFDDIVIDNNLWNRTYVALPVADLCPAIKDPNSGQHLHEITKRLSQGQFVKVHPEIVYE